MTPKLQLKMLEMILEKYVEAIELNNWGAFSIFQVWHDLHLPRQRNGFDYGLFVMKYMHQPHKCFLPSFHVSNFFFSLFFSVFFCFPFFFFKSKENDR